MGKLPIKGGTPVGSASLCRSCSSAQVMTGYRESDFITMCDRMYRPIVVPFAMYQCTGYHDKNRPDWEQMEKLAIDIASAPMKPVGFKTGVGFAAAVAAEDDD